MSDSVSLVRLYLMRLLCFMNFAFLGASVWPDLIHPARPWDPIPGVAYSFWAALSLLMGLGIRYPLRMLPVFFMQLTYKAIWLIAVALPMSHAGRSTGMTKVFVGGVIADLIVIPWGYVFTHFVKQGGDRWR